MSVRTEERGKRGLSLRGLDGFRGDNLVISRNQHFLPGRKMQGSINPEISSCGLAARCEIRGTSETHPSVRQDDAKFGEKSEFYRSSRRCRNIQ